MQKSLKAFNFRRSQLQEILKDLLVLIEAPKTRITYKQVYKKIRDNENYPKSIKDPIH